MNTLMLLTLPAAMLFANVGEPSSKVMHLDTNQDNVISVDEAQGSHLERRFAELDKDQSGTLTQSELKASRGGRANKHRDHEAFFKALDTNGNGALEKTEVEGKRFAKHFDAIDTNGDGSVSKAELQAAKRQMKGHHRGKHDPKAWFAKLDANQDGRLTPVEVEGRPLAQHFSKIDANQDGAITPEELQAAHANHRAHKRGAQSDRPRGPNGEMAQRGAGRTPRT